MNARQSSLPLIGSFLLLAIGGTELRADQPLPQRCGFSEEVALNAVRLRNGEATIQMERPSGYTSWIEDALGRFRVHYTTTGIDAVPSADANLNGIPDYPEIALESLNYAWRIQVDEMGYRSPPLDDGAGGSSAIDVYLHDLSKAGASGGGIYGRTRTDKQISSGTTTSRFTCFMEIDNDFSEDDVNQIGTKPFATFGTDALKATCAHEFAHVIQIGSYSFGLEELMIYEMSATWMELRVYPDIRDWAVYMGALLQRPDGFPFSRTTSSNGYAWGWFGNVLALDGGDAVLRRTWEKIALGTRPYVSLVEACSETGEPFEERFCKGLQVLYKTGSRAKAPTVLPDAYRIREIALRSDERAVPPSMIATGTLRPFEVTALRWSVPQAEALTVVGVLLTNADVTSMLNNLDNAAQYTVRLTERGTSGDIVAGTSWTLALEGEDLCSFRDGVATRKDSAPFPMPFVHGTHNVLYVPCSGAVPGDDAVLRIYTTSMALLSVHTIQLEVRGATVVAPLEVSSNLRPGVYIVVVDANDTTEQHKVVVR